MRSVYFLLFGLFLGAIAPLPAQKLPESWSFSPGTHIMNGGGTTVKGFYKEETVENIYLTFTQPDFWQQMTNNYAAKREILATLTYDGVRYDSVGVRFKGMTSYSGARNSEKRSFNISLDFVRPGQDVKGYKTLNLNNAFGDPSFMREVLYYHQIRRHTPAARANFVRLFINGKDWGLYPNIQQLNKDFLEEWFYSNDGSNWRADRPAGATGGPGGFGNGTTALNYLGEDTARYKTYYDLKSSSHTQPWKALVDVCRVLNQTPLANLESALSDHLDIDRTLWHLASEVAFSDDDSYIHKGGMDYYLYRDMETGRFMTLDYDGNSVMNRNFATWSPFYNAEKPNYPLLNRLLAVPEVRQRYLAHLRVLIRESLDTASTSAIINRYAALVDTIVQKDPKKMTTYAQFRTDLGVLKTFISSRRNFLLANAEVGQPSPAIGETAAYVNQKAWANPTDKEAIVVQTKVSFVTGVNAVHLYYGAGTYGKFVKTLMFDDGAHGDGAANDGLYAAAIPPQAAGSWVRYYIEAVANNPAKSVSYHPVGAEHDVFLFQVKANVASSTDVVINEFMASNRTGAKDEAGQFEDWVELYNRSTRTVDLSNYTITDNAANLKKWVFPAGTTLASNEYLILWADEDQNQGKLHTNFKLAAEGEILIFSNAEGLILDSLTFGIQKNDISWARKPNGTGSFSAQPPTFGANNNTTGTNEVLAGTALRIVPNPATHQLRLELDAEGTYPVRVFNSTGALMYYGLLQQTATLDASAWSPGLYAVHCGGRVAKLMIVR